MNIALKNCKSHNAPLAGQCSLLIILSGSTWEGKEVSVNTPANISAERETHEKDLLVVQPKKPLVQ